MDVITKLHVGLFQQAFTLDVNPLIGIDQNIGNGWIGQKRLQRTQPEYLVQHLLDEAFAPLQVHGSGFAMNNSFENQADLTPYFFAIHIGKLVEIQFLNQLSVDSGFDGAVVCARCGCDNRRHSYLISLSGTRTSWTTDSSSHPPKCQFRPVGPQSAGS